MVMAASVEHSMEVIASTDKEGGRVNEPSVSAE